MKHNDYNQELNQRNSSSKFRHIMPALALLLVLAISACTSSGIGNQASNGGGHQAVSGQKSSTSEGQQAQLSTFETLRSNLRKGTFGRIYNDSMAIQNYKDGQPDGFSNQVYEDNITFEGGYFRLDTDVAGLITKYESKNSGIVCLSGLGCQKDKTPEVFSQALFKLVSTDDIKYVPDGSYSVMGLPKVPCYSFDINLSQGGNASIRYCASSNGFPIRLEAKGVFPFGSSLPNTMTHLEQNYTEIGTLQNVPSGFTKPSRY